METKVVILKMKNILFLLIFCFLKLVVEGIPTNASSDEGHSALIFGSPKQYQKSPPFYPSPEGGRLVSEWKNAYARAREIVNTLNIAQKVNITTGTTIGRCSGNTGFVHGKGLEIEDGFCLNDGPLGVRGTDLVSAFPAGISASSSFNRTLLRLRGKAIGAEFKAKGADMVLGPVCGPIGYKALAGRVWEGFGPDPYLQGVSIKETVEGTQSENIIAVSKHFIGNEQEHNRLNVSTDDPTKVKSISSNIDDRAMHEIYLWPFAEAVRAGTGSVMCSYNKINGSDACANSYTLNKLLKEELGFQGFVMSDWYATKSGVASALSGLDMDMPGNTQSGGSFFGANLTQAVVNGTVPEERLNDMATRILASWFFVSVNHTGPNFSVNTEEKYDNLYSSEFVPKKLGPEVLVNENIDARTDFSYQVSEEAALQAITLIKNENSALPLKKENGIRHLLLLGPGAVSSKDGFNCDSLSSCLDGAHVSGYGSGAGQPAYFLMPAEGVAERCKQEKIQYDIVTESFNFTYPYSKAKSADAAIVFVFSHSGEVVAYQGDRQNASLWYNADNLIANVSSTNNNTIVVIMTPGSVNIESFVENKNVTGILMSSYLGQDAGLAISKVLFGDYNPSGRLPFTIAKDDNDYVPINYDDGPQPQDNFTRSIFLDYRYFDYYNITPRFEFGYGLSYSNYSFSNMQVQEVKVPKETLDAAGSYSPSYEFRHNDLDPEQYKFPSNISKVDGFIYPYLENTDVNTTEKYPYPEGYSTKQLSTPSLPGGGVGGNPSLWDVSYKVSAQLENTGPYDGAYVAQLYIGYPCSEKFPVPPRQLRGFDKVYLTKGQKATVDFDITRKDLSVWDVESQSWIVQRGTYKVYVGSSSRNLELMKEVSIH